MGDLLYGLRKPSLSIHRHMLHAEKLSFVHPISKKKVAIKAAMPEDFKKALDTLEL